MTNLILKPWPLVLPHKLIATQGEAIVNQRVSKPPVNKAKRGDE